MTIDPVIFKIGFFELRWYSVAYILGFLCAYLLFFYLNKFASKEDFLQKEKIEKIFNYWVFGVILGGRLGFVLFYDISYFISNPIKIFAIWEGGMSFHGGLLGVIVATFIFAKKHDLNVWNLFDRSTISAYPALFFGRIANFINGELWGKPTREKWGVIFPFSGDLLPRHPSQIYEALLEALLPFLIMLAILFRSNWFQKHGKFSGLFLLMYSIARFFIEQFFREPHGVYSIFNIALSTGQILCFPMFLLGFYLVFLKNNSSTR
jgi:phosphatidylglycerol:prolipoprotein diacylglycerol transferase